MIPLSVPNVTGNENAYLTECVRSTFVSSVGPFVTRFEESVAEISGQEHAVACSAGTTGLQLALVALGLKPGEMVIVPTYSFIATANAVSHAGGCPWFLDVNPETWTLDASTIEAALTAQAQVCDGVWVHVPTGRRIAGLMPVFPMHAADMRPLRALADREGFFLLADAAASLGARYGGAPATQLADAAVFSFNGNKTFTAGGGGALVTDDPVLAKRAKHLSTTARCGQDYLHDEIGFNFRMTNVNAAIGCAQLERAGEFLAKKKNVSETYAHAFSAHPSLRPFPNPAYGESSHWFSGVVLDHGLPPAAWFCSFLSERGVAARTFWRPLHLQPAYAGASVFGGGVAEDLSPRVLPLPCSTQITDDEIQTVIRLMDEAMTLVP